MKPLLALLSKRNPLQNFDGVSLVADSGDERAQVLPDAEISRLEQLFKDRLVNGILYQAKLEWQDFDIESFLRLIEMSDLEKVCRKVSVDDGGEQGLSPACRRDADRQKKKRNRERQKAYERLMCEMRLLTEILKALGAPAEQIKIAGLVGVIKDARRSQGAKFEARVYKKKPESPVRYTYPAVLRENRSLVFEDDALVHVSPFGGLAAGSSMMGEGGLGLDAPDVEEEAEFELSLWPRLERIRLIGEEAL